jgi:pimeloyl-ACP methyl ester carboxylesterase
MVHQSAVYMRNGPVPRPDPAFEPGAFFQIQGRLQAALKADTRVVIGHSLGSVIAYEGLCLHVHAVRSFITVGSPIATRRLILRPLRERLQRLINAPLAAAPPWPSVARWTNFFAPADVWSVPVKRLAPLFDPRIADIEVKHGNPHRAVETHKLASYLRHRALLDEIARGLEPGPRRDRSQAAA